MSRKRWFSAERANLDGLIEEHGDQFAFLRDTIPTLAVSPVGSDSVLLDEVHVRQLKEAGAAVENKPTDLDGIRLVTFFVGGVASSSRPAETTRTARTKKPTVSLGRWQGDFDPYKFRDIVEKMLLPSLKRDVTVTVVHGGTQKANTNDKKFVVWVWAGPKNTSRRVRVPHTMWGTEVSCHDEHDRVFYPDDSDGYIPIITDEEDTVAVMNDKNLYILFDAVHHGVGREEVILQKIFEQARLVFEAGMKVVEKSPEELKKISDTYRATYVKLCMERVSGDFKEMKKKVASLVSAVEQNRAEMLEMVAELNRTQRSLAGFDEATAKHAGRFAAEWDALLKVPKVLSATCNDSGLTVMTDTVYVKHPKTKTWYRIGQFRVTIPTDGRITFCNLSGRKNTHGADSDERWRLHAPHVFGDGHACFGNVENTVRELLAKHEYAALVQVLIMFLSQANVADAAGQYLTKWPVVTESEALGKKTVKTVKSPVRVKKRAA